MVDETSSLFDGEVDLENLAARSGSAVGKYHADSHSIRTIIEAPDFIGQTEMGARTRVYTVIRDADTLKLKTMHPGLPRDIRGY